MPLKERILVGGVPGVGKTYSWLTIARMCPNNKFYVIDPDDGVRRVWYNEFSDVNNIEYYFTPRWYADGATKVPTVSPIAGDKNCYLAGVADAWKTIKPKLKIDDWIVVEHLGNLWAKVQDGFADEVFSKDIGQYFLEVRKQMSDRAKRLDALKGWVDWQVINKLHNDDFMVPVCFDNPAHVFMTSSVTMSSGTDEDEEVKAFYGETRLRFDGQKHNPFRAQTILILRASGRANEKKYFVSTFQKDRGRDWVDSMELYDFALQYLCGVAGWS